MYDCDDVLPSRVLIGLKCPQVLVCLELLCLVVLSGWICLILFREWLLWARGLAGPRSGCYPGSQLGTASQIQHVTLNTVGHLRLAYVRMIQLAVSCLCGRMPLPFSGIYKAHVGPQCRSTPRNKEPAVLFSFQLLLWFFSWESRHRNHPFLTSLAPTVTESIPPNTHLKNTWLCSFANL